MREFLRRAGMCADGERERVQGLLVLGLRDVIHFQGTCVAELKQSLAESVDDYLTRCGGINSC